MLDSARRCFASLFTDRAISYREAKDFDHLKVALSIGVQQMVRSDLAGAGVMFSIIALECRAIRHLRENMGFTNVLVMIPFCRSKRGEKGLEIYVMCEIPANVILADAFAKRFDGFSIGSNDLTQLTLGVDRDSELLASSFDEQNDAVKWMISSVIQAAHRAGAKVGLCGQAPSNHPEFAEFLVDCGIDSISVVPDSFLGVKTHVAVAESTKAPSQH